MAHADIETFVAEFQGSGLLFDQAMAQTRMSVCITDPRLPNNPIVFANEAFQKMTGYSMSELLGRNCRLLQGPGTNREHTAKLRESIEAEKSIVVELLNYRKDGTPFWNALHVGPIYGKDGELLYYFGSQLDVTDVHEARKTTRELQLATGQFRHRLKNLARRLKRVSKAPSRPDDRLSAIERAYDEHHDAAPRAGLDLSLLVARVMDAYAGRTAGRYAASGPRVAVPDERLSLLGLCLHELATHALKHGAWSDGGGEIAIRWGLPESGLLRIDWIESDGPRPASGGFIPGTGTSVLSGLMQSVGGELEHVAGGEGSHIRLTLPLKDAPNA